MRKYECTNCDWIGTKDELLEENKMFGKNIFWCPQCRSSSDFISVKQETKQEKIARLEFENEKLKNVILTIIATAEAYEWIMCDENGYELDADVYFKALIAE